MYILQVLVRLLIIQLDAMILMIVQIHYVDKDVLIAFHKKFVRHVIMVIFCIILLNLQQNVLDG
jgi:hypothetical protein